MRGERMGVDTAVSEMGFRSTSLRWLLPALLLVLVAAVHVADRRTEDLTPWKGGGFAMFSTIDSPSERLIRIELRTSSGVVAVEPPAMFRDEIADARNAPADDRIRRLALLFAQQQWVRPRVELPELGTEPSDHDLQESLGQALGALRIRPVDPERFDPTVHQKVEIQGVTVLIYRLEAQGFTTLEPRLLQRSSAMAPEKMP